MLKEFNPRIKAFRLMAMTVLNESLGRKKNVEWDLAFKKSTQIELLTSSNANAPALVAVVVEIEAKAQCKDNSIGDANFSAKYRTLFALSSEVSAEMIDKELSSDGDLNYFVEAQASILSVENFKSLLNSSGFDVREVGYSI